MLFLEVIEGADKNTKIGLRKGRTSIGRQDDNQLRLNDKNVSRVHCQVTVDDSGSVFLSDNNSRNGTFFRGGLLKGSTLIFPGEVFKVGGSTILLRQEQDNSAQQPSISCQPMVPFTHELRGGGHYTPANQSRRSMPLSATRITIGRDDSNDLVLKHPMVSRFHAQIVTQNGRPVLQDLNSVNGTYVDGVRLKQPMPLQPNSLVQICGFRYVFDGQKLIEYEDNAGQLHIEVQNLGRTIKTPENQNRILLNDISLNIAPREFVALLGGSGAGKSTLLGALTGMKPASSGQILINGRNFYREYDVFRTMIGYVPQDDIVHQELTVEEVLTYSARLRMPDDTSEAEIQRALEQVLKDLELTRHRSTPVHSLSGGQRKRVSIGVELLTSPSLFFLDEPTSGLDPGLEKTMMEMLRRLADQGRTIVLVTHATFNIHLCDKVVFLAEGGSLAFFGTPSEALAFFQAVDFAEIYQKLGTQKQPGEWAAQYRASQLCRKYGNLPQAGQTRGTNPNSAGDHPAVIEKTSGWRQWKILTSRYARILCRDRKNFIMLLLQPVLIGLLIAAVFSSSHPFELSKMSHDDLNAAPEKVAAEGTDYLTSISQNNAAENKTRSKASMTVAMMIFTAIWLGTSNSAREIVKELPVYRRERLVNLRIAPYLFSKITVLALVCLGQVLLFMLLMSVGLHMSHYWLNSWALFLVALAAVMMGLAVSATVSNNDKAMTIIPVLLLPQIILSGAMIPQSSVPPAVRGIFDLAIAKWGWELVGGGIIDINQFTPFIDPTPALTGNFAGHWWILALFIVLFYLLSTWTVWRKDKVGA